VLAISSGKARGQCHRVGHLAAALAAQGHKVGLMDATSTAATSRACSAWRERPGGRGGKIQPSRRHGVKLMSLGFIVERDAPAIWRGPIIMKIITQFLRDVAWGSLELLPRGPPPAGRRQLSLTQAIRLHARDRTTPQEMAVGDSCAVAKMLNGSACRRGIVENMSTDICPTR